jgi:uncharacterized membrane protein YagU involved in acid resistance
MNHSVLSKVLFGFNVLGVLAAEGAILTQFELFGSVLLVLHGVVVPLLALCASERHLDTRSSFSHIFRHLLIDFAPVGT